MNSTTILLPAWYDTLEKLKLGQRIMPRDVSTRWNSTFDMLDFAVRYQTAIDSLTQRWDLGLWDFELSADEWDIATNLRDILKVSQLVNVTFKVTSDRCLTSSLAMSSLTDKAFSHAISQQFHFSHTISQQFHFRFDELTHTIYTA